MPGYLTSMMVLIETDKWLGDLEDTLNKKDAAARSKLEAAVLDLAHKVRNDYLRYVNSLSLKGFPPPQNTQIDNKIGDGLSQYAFAGALGPDIAAAGNILALNQRWVSDTMHQGSQRRAWQKAGTTKFVLNEPANIEGVIRNPSNQVFVEYNKLNLTLRIGHLASVATHVIVQPFIQQWAWANQEEPSTASKILPWPFGSDLNKGDPVKFSVQIDAKLAQAYFQRDDLHAGQSWTAYLPGDGKAIDFFCSRYLDSFGATYGTDPKEATCTVPAESQILTDLPDLKALLPTLDKKSSDLLENKLKHWGGWPLGTLGFAYGDLFTEKDFTDKDTLKVDKDAMAALNSAVDKIKGLQSKMTDFPCSAPNLDRDFLGDAYKNTRNWALDAGYDHAPWVVSLVMSAVILFTSSNPIHPPDSATGFEKFILNILGFGVTQNVWSNTVNFDASTKVMQTNRQAWIDSGLAQETIWFDMFDQGYGAQGIPLFFYNSVLTGVSLLGFDGIFGQNADALSGLPKYHPRKLYVLFNDLISPLFFFPVLLQTLVVDWYRQPGWRWSFYWIVNVGFDGLEELLIARGNRSTGLQGDAIGLRIWYLRLWTTGAFILGSALAFGVKAGSPRNNPDTQPSWKDYLLALVFPLVLIGTIVWWKSGFEAGMLQALTGVEWPSTSTDLVDDLLLVDQKDKVKSIRAGTGTPLPVALFEAAKLKTGDDTDADGKAVPNSSFFPEGEASTEWDARPAADEKARKDAHKASDKTYQLKQLFDRAAIFSGLLSMALVNYDQADAGKKDVTSAIFKDWNLNYRTDDEWNDLMETSGSKPGLLPAAEQWVADLKASRASDQAVLDRLNEAFALQGAAA
jgi:hypothetical protein